MNVAPLEYDTGNFLGVGVWPGQVSFAEAADFCRSHYGTDLASIHFQWQIDEITDSAFWAYIDHDRSMFDLAWFGGLWNSSEPAVWPGAYGQWLWVDNTPFDPEFDDQFRVMAYSIADEDRGDDEFMCTSLVKGPGGWRPIKCEDNTDAFICHKYRYTFLNRGNTDIEESSDEDDDSGESTLTYISDFDAMLVEIPDEFGRESDFITWNDSKQWCEQDSNISFYAFQSNEELENLTALTAALNGTFIDMSEDVNAVWVDHPSMLIDSNLSGDCSSVDLIVTENDLYYYYYVSDYNLTFDNCTSNRGSKAWMCRLPNSNERIENASQTAEIDPNLQFEWEEWLDFCEQVKSDYGNEFGQDCNLVQRFELKGEDGRQSPPYGDEINEGSTEYLLGWITIAHCDTWFENGENHLKIPFDSQTSNHFWSGLWSYGASVKIRGISASDLSSTQTGSLSFCGGYDSSEEQKNSLIANRQAHNVGIMSVPYSWPIDNLKRGFAVSHEYDWLEYRDSNERYIFNDTNVRSVDDSRASVTWIGRADFVSDNLQSNRDCVLNDVSDDDASGLTARSLTRWKQGSFFVGTLNDPDVCAQGESDSTEVGGLLFTSDRCTWSANNAGMSGFESKMPQFMQMQIGFRINRESFEQAVNLTGNVTCSLSNEELEQNGTLYYHTDCEVRKNVDDVNSEASDETVRIVSTVLDSEDKCETQEFDYASAAESLTIENIPMMDINDYLNFCNEVDRSSGQKCYTIHAMFDSLESQARMKERAEWKRINEIPIFPGANGKDFGYGDILFVNENNTESIDDEITYYLGWIEVMQCDNALSGAQFTSFSPSMEDDLFSTIWEYGASVRISKRLSSEVCAKRSFITKPFSWPIENIKRGFEMSAPVSFRERFDDVSQRYTFDQGYRVYSSNGNPKGRREMEQFTSNDTIWIGRKDWMQRRVIAGRNKGNVSSLSETERIFYQPGSRKGIAAVSSNCGYSVREAAVSIPEHFLRVFVGFLLDPTSVRNYLKRNRWSYYSSNDHHAGKQPLNGKISEQKKKLRVMAGYVDCDGYEKQNTRFKQVKPMEDVFCMPLWILVLIGYISSWILGWFSFTNMRYVAIEAYANEMGSNNPSAHIISLSDKIHDETKQGVVKVVESEVTNAVVDGITEYLFQHRNDNDDYYYAYTQVPLEVGQEVARFSVELDDTETIPLMKRFFHKKIFWAWVFHYTLLSLRCIFIILALVAITIEYNRFNVRTRSNNNFFFSGYHGVWFAYMYHPLFAKAAMYWFGMQTGCLENGGHWQPEWMIWFELIDKAEDQVLCSCLQIWYIILVFVMAIYQWIWMGLIVIVRLATGISVYLIPYGVFFGLTYWWRLCIPSTFLDRRNRDYVDGCGECTINIFYMSIEQFVFETHDEFMLGINLIEQTRMKKRKKRRMMKKYHLERLDREKQEKSIESSNGSSKMAPLMRNDSDETQNDEGNQNNHNNNTLDTSSGPSAIEMVISSNVAGQTDDVLGQDGYGVELTTRVDGSSDVLRRTGEEIIGEGNANDNNNNAGNREGSLSEGTKFAMAQQAQLYNDDELQGLSQDDINDEEQNKESSKSSSNKSDNNDGLDEIEFNVITDRSEMYANRTCEEYMWDHLPFLCSTEESYDENDYSRPDLFRRHVMRQYILHCTILTAISTFAWFWYTPMSMAAAVFLTGEEDWVGGVKYGWTMRFCRGDSAFMAFDTSSWVAWTLLLSWLII